MVLQLVYGWQAAFCRELREPSSVLTQDRVPDHVESARALSSHRREGAVEFLRTLRLQDLKLHPQRPSRDLHFSQSEYVHWIGRIPEDGHPGEVGDHLLEQLQMFADYLRAGKQGQPRDVPA